MIVLYTDFGLSGPYLGQMKAVLYQQAPAIAVVDLFANAPVYNVRVNSYLLASYVQPFPQGTVFLAVVDPGVGSETRLPVVMKCDGRWYVGPGNGLFDILAKRAQQCELWEIQWQPAQISNSFHGRDLFAPVAAMLATGQLPEMSPLALDQQRLSSLSDDLAEIIYIDHFGNLITGVRAASAGGQCSLHYRGSRIPRVKTFSDVPMGTPLCYENSNGLLEIALNQGRANRYFEAAIGDSFELAC